MVPFFCVVVFPRRTRKSGCRNILMVPLATWHNGYRVVVSAHECVNVI